MYTPLITTHDGLSAFHCSPVLYEYHQREGTQNTVLQT